MKCAKCQTENPETRKFCKECGAKLMLPCPQCGFQNNPGDKFCGECGHQLSLHSKPTPKDLSFDEKLRKIQKYLPSGLTEKILAQKDRIEGERKQVTVMFCDMEGFTPLVEKLGPEEAYGLLDKVLEILIHKVHDYEGTVNKMTGDGIMALFGAPIALEDAPQRAIRSAHAIHWEMARFSEKLKQEKSLPPIRMRVGINTGLVVIGTLGNDLRVEFTAVGDTVNLASRMEGLAEPGATYVTEDTFKLTEGLFRFEALGEKQVKGKETPLKIYRVIAPSTRRTRFDVSAERGLTFFVGRERELELLLDGLERVREGRGQAFSIMGEAGVGKSRLLYEFRKTIINEDVTFLEGKCLSYGRGMSFHPIIDVLKSNFNIQEGDRDNEVREKVQRGLGVLRVDEASTLPYLLELLPVKDSGIDLISMSPEGRKDRIVEALKQIILRGSEVRPLVMVIEDLHWMDKSSEEALKYFLESIPGARVLLLFTHRPDFVNTWGGKSYHNQITLNRLSNRESLSMVAHLLESREIDKDLEKLILEKTEGVPFFIEELLKSLKDLKIIEKKYSKYQLAKDAQSVAIPSTIQDMIMARVDSLPDDTKAVLQTGSVIEREFPYDLIRRVTGLSEQHLLTHLSALKDSELLYERGIYPNASYIFRHALTREVVYESIMANKKKKLHEEIGKGIEDFYGDHLTEQYGVLADHFYKSGNFAKADEYSRLAGKKAAKSAYFPDAIFHTKKRIASLERLPQTDEVQKEITHASTTLGLYFIQLNYPVKAKEAVEPIVDIAMRIGHKHSLSQIHSILGHYEYLVEEEFPKALVHFEEALKLSNETKEILAVFFTNYCLGLTLMWNCSFEQASRHFENALEVNVKANNLYGISAMKSFLSWVNLFRGNINLGYKFSEEALRIAEDSGDIYSKTIAYSIHGYSLLSKGSFAEAEKHLLKGIEFCERTNFFIWNALAHDFLGEMYFELRQYEKSKYCYEKGISSLEQAEFGPSRGNFYRIGVARARVMGNENDIHLEHLIGYVEKNKIREVEGAGQRFISEILFNIDELHMSEAETWIQKAIEADQRNGMRFRLGNDYALYAKLLNRKGDRLKAQENLGKAIEILKECGADGWVSKYEREMASIA